MDHENIMLSEISQFETAKNHMNSLIWRLKLKPIDADNSELVTRRKGGGGMLVKGKYRVTEGNL